MAPPSSYSSSQLISSGARLPGRNGNGNDTMAGGRASNVHLKFSPAKLEEIAEYYRGGLHPLHLGDRLGDNHRYRVIHKLSHCEFATSWLCRDLLAPGGNQYVTVRIIRCDLFNQDGPPKFKIRDLQKSCKDETNIRDDDAANFICSPLDIFSVEGPNGVHCASVYPVLGPAVSSGLAPLPSNLEGRLREIGKQLVGAVDWMHYHGVCHGDITAENVLYLVSGLNGLSEEQVLAILGQPRCNPVVLDAMENHGDPRVPMYLVYPVQWRAVDLSHLDYQPCLVDFGEAFRAWEPPISLGLPGPFRSPDLILEGKGGYASDIWALGCTLFELRTGRVLFEVSNDADDDEILIHIVDVLGPMPEPWWSVTWRHRQQWYRDEADEHGCAIAIRDDASPREPDDTQHEDMAHPSSMPEARSIPEKLEPGLWYLFEDGPCREYRRDISQRERMALAHLLASLLAWNPWKRLTAQAALDHEWFKL